MPDPTDNTLPDPQSLVDSALATPPTPAAATIPEPPKAETLPPVVAPPSPAIVMTDETPLAFAMPAPTMSKPDLTPPANENMGSSYLPPTPPVAVPPEPVKKKGGSKLMMAILGIFGLLGALGAGGYYTYQQYGTPKQPEVAAISEAKCNGCSKPQDGGWLVWRNGECKVTGTCNSTANNPGNQNTDNPTTTNAINNATNFTTCEAARGTWCDSVDSAGRAYKFCIPDTSTKGCNQVAVEKGYTISYELKCIQSGGTWTSTLVVGVNGVTAPTKASADLSCSRASGNFGTGAYLCKEGVKGTGNVVYSGGPCTELNGVRFTGSTACFCGTVQVDTGAGHTSYTSTCGCNQASTPPSAPPSAPPSTPPTTPVLSCTGLTVTPTTTPVVGDNLLFTCAGSVVPAGATRLSYFYRSSLNDGAWTTMATDRSATPKGMLKINACGTYKVECKVCGTIGTAQVCDPVWVGATQ